MNLYTAATKDGGIRSLNEVTLINFGDGHGAMIVESADFDRVKRIAETEPASLICARDVRHFADLFQTRVTRPGAHIETSGRVEDLVRVTHGMHAAGVDYGSWNIPRVVKQVVRQRAVQGYPQASPTAA